MDEFDWESFKKEVQPKKSKKTRPPKSKAPNTERERPPPSKAEIPIIKQPSSSKAGTSHLNNFTNFVNQFTRKAERDLKKGDVKIDAKLDLHGCFVDDAHARVKKFIQASSQQNKKTLLVITGRGSKNEGVIKSEFRHWLEDADVKPLILRFKTAHAKHGGDGAYYIFLRSKRSR